MKTILAVLVGIGIALALSYASKKMGGQCTLLCNPYLAAIGGGIAGLVFALGQGK
jgi:hypothetical protein